MKINPFSLDAIELTLSELGWVSQDNDSPKMKLWVPSANANLESRVLSEEVGVFVPQDDAAPDFERLVSRAIAQLSEYSAENVLEELDVSTLRIRHSLDKFVVASEGSAVQNGLVDWNIGVDLVGGLSEILSSGAKSAHQNKAWYRGASNVIAKNYLDSCLMGQTEVGSYVVKAFVPANKPLSVSDSVKQKKQSQLIAREVSKSVFASVQATHEVLDEYLKEKRPEVFEIGMTQGVSVEMLEGFGHLINNDETEISVEFVTPEMGNSSGRPFKGAVLLTPAFKEGVETGVATLKKSSSPTRLMISGEVTELKRVWDDPDSARIKMRAASPRGKMRTYTVHLKSDDYESAVLAHTDEKQLSVSGIAELGEFIQVERVKVTNAPVGKNSKDGRDIPPKGISGQMGLLD